jgi:hypothetical protein
MNSTLDVGPKRCRVPSVKMPSMCQSKKEVKVNGEGADLEKRHYFFVLKPPFFKIL